MWSSLNGTQFVSWVNILSFVQHAVSEIWVSVCLHVQIWFDYSQNCKGIMDKLKRGSLGKKKNQSNSTTQKRGKLRSWKLPGWLAWSR